MRENVRRQWKMAHKLSWEQITSLFPSLNWTKVNLAANEGTLSISNQHFNMAKLQQATRRGEGKEQKKRQRVKSRAALPSVVGRVDDWVIGQTVKQRERSDIRWRWQRRRKKRRRRRRRRPVLHSRPGLAYRETLEFSRGLQKMGWCGPISAGVIVEIKN